MPGGVSGDVTPESPWGVPTAKGHGAGMGHPPQHGHRGGSHAINQNFPNLILVMTFPTFLIV